MKRKIILPFLLFVLFLTTYQVSFAQSGCYLDASATAQVVASSVSGPVTTGCDMFNIDTALVVAVYVWAGPNTGARIAWQTNGGTIRDTVLQDSAGLTPDVALVSYRSVAGLILYAVVAY